MRVTSILFYLAIITLSAFAEDEIERTYHETRVSSEKVIADLTKCETQRDLCYKEAGVTYSSLCTPSQISNNSCPVCPMEYKNCQSCFDTYKKCLQKAREVPENYGSSDTGYDEYQTLRELPSQSVSNPLGK